MTAPAKRGHRAASRSSGPAQRGAGFGQAWAGFTLVELMVVIALVAVILGLAAPSMKEMIEVRRLRAINAQLLTDFQFAKSEAVARRTFAKIDFNNDAALTCYTIYTSNERKDRCDCTKTAGDRCKGSAVEIRTVQVPRSTGSLISVPDGQDWYVGFEPTMGGLVSIPIDFDPVALPDFYVDTAIDTTRALRIMLNGTGRPLACTPAGSKLDLASCKS